MHFCSMCPYFCKDFSLFCTHSIRKHRFSQNFKIHCSFSGCGASYKNYKSFKSHIYRKHSFPQGNVEECEMEDENDLNEIEEIYMPIIKGNDTDDKTKEEARFLLKLKVGHNNSESAIDEVIDGVKEICHKRFELLRSKLPADQLTEDTNFLLDSSNMFKDLESTFLRQKAYEKNLKCLMPKSVCMGKFPAYKRKNTNRIKDIIYKTCFGYYVPFFESLSQLLSLPEVYNIIIEGIDRPSNSEFFNDIQDGSYLKDKAHLTGKPRCLLFGAYNDDFLITNPIGSHAKPHKLSIFYYILLNLPPQYRSKLQAIQLIAVANTSYIKSFGTQALLKDFTNGLKQLEQGVLLKINRQEILFHGMLTMFLADTLAAQLVGGFKEGVAKAKKPCRSCEISNVCIKDNLSSFKFVERDEQEHRDRVKFLKALPKIEAKAWSMKWGINNEGFLFDIPNFELTKCLLHDPMHILLEGLDRLCLRLLLINICQTNKYVSLKEFNYLIQNFEYGRKESLDRPQPIQVTDLRPNSTLRQTAASMKNLIILLPLIIGHKIPVGDPFWENFLCLQKINILCLSPIVSERTYHHLITLIATHNYHFTSLFPNQSIPPKLHYLQHLPEQLLRFGPLRHHWCMRLEGKHGLIKNKKWKNFRNLSKSVAEYHQRWMCLQQTDGDGNASHTYLTVGNSIKEGNIANFEDFKYKDLLKQKLENKSVPTILITSEVSMKGLTYELGTILVTDLQDGHEPSMGSILNIAVVDNEIFFICNKIGVLDYFEHYNCFHISIISDAIDIFVVNPTYDLKYVWPQVAYSIEGKLCVILQNIDTIWGC